MHASWARGVALAAFSIALGAAPARAEGPPVERRLHLAAAEASSYLVSDWAKFQENYLPLYVGDDDPKTAWTEGVKGDGLGEWLRLRVTPMTGATRVRLRVRNGYQKTDRLFAANTRAKGVSVVLLPSKKTVEVELGDRQDWQEIVVEQPAGAFEAVELHAKSVYPGNKYDDLCISDVQILVTATTPENPAFEKSRLDKILSWKAERLAAAKLFKSASAKNLPIAAQYAIKEDETQRERPKRFAACGKRLDHTCIVLSALQDAREDAAARASHGEALERAIKAIGLGWKAWTPVQPIARDTRRIPSVDGLCTPGLNGCQADSCYQALPLPSPAYLGFLHTSQVAALEVKNPPAIEDVVNSKLKECQRRSQVTSWGWVLRGKPGADGTAPIEMLYVASCGTFDTREGWSHASDTQLYVYDGEGRLQIVAGHDYASMLTWRRGASGPVLAGGRRTGGGGLPDITATEAVNVAAK
jgi:hypothetical protein